ncbi:uncharacterized protein [Macrobrachium rosenbergii]|uniref:uncharacterized protein isoform X3 n=1 Tax=Macrobrachium rosenbergii TaxID=79674 RepID=UPI0034D3CAAE
MPALKDVIPLENMCVQKITQHLVDIVQLSSSKIKENQDDSSSESKIPKECQENGNVQNEAESSALEIKPKADNMGESCDQLNDERLETYKKELISLLTSHSDVSLHDKLFSSFVSKCSDYYIAKKKLRPFIQELVPRFLNSSLRELDFGKSRMFSEAEMCQIIFDHLENASRLQTLDIGRSCYWRIGVFENLSSKLKSLPELTVLKIQYICTPEMITGLADACPNILELNLKGSERITDEDCSEIAKCVSLKCLDITGTRITGKGCWKIIDSIKVLSWLQHCAFNCNSDALLFESRAQLFDCIKQQVNRQNEPVEMVGSPGLINVFNLKNFWLFNPRTEDMFSMLLCPHLEFLRMDFIFQDLIEEPDVEVISQIPMINKLQANLYDRCVVDLVSQMIEGCGCKLTTLDLHLADDYFYAAQVHNVVARCCPNLVNLSFSGDYKADSERVFRARHSLDESDDCLDFEIQAPAHPHLENLSVTGVVSDSRLRFLLSHTPAVRNLHLDGELEWLHDDMFKTLLDENPLTKLEYVWFNVSTTITLNTVRLLLLHENSVRTIGRLCHMAESTMSEYQELQDLVRQRNLDVKLIWVTDERNRYD